MRGFIYLPSHVHTHERVNKDTYIYISECVRLYASLVVWFLVYIAGLVKNLSMPDYLNQSAIISCLSERILMRFSDLGESSRYII